MKTEKIKRYRISVSRTFPKTHPRAGEPTLFREKILKGCNQLLDPCHILTNLNPKIHTIRANYHLWKKRIDEVNTGEAILSVRYWSGKPYNSKHLRVAEFDKDSGCGVQELKFVWNDINYPWLYSEEIASGNLRDADFKTETLAKNDGLSLEDFKAWFDGYDLSEPMAIIHFTSFRY